jgi:hypothetical protein
MANWLETAFGLGDEAEPIEPSPLQAPEVKSFVCVVAQPSGAPGDLGETVDAWYIVEGGALMLCDKDGKTSDVKPYRLAAGENERAVAGRLRRAAWQREPGRSAFNDRRLNYGSLGFA